LLNFHSAPRRHTGQDWIIMQVVGTTSIAQGHAALVSLLERIKANKIDWNEAETRFQIIDALIVDCLGWHRDVVRLEQHQDRQYSDYELGLPRRAIWEAKRERRTFELPAAIAPTNLISDLPSLIALKGEVAEAIQQVQDYCTKRGVEVAVATNGNQLVAFLASRGDGVAPLEGRCFVIRDHAQLLEHFPKIWQMLSPAGIAERRLSRFLNVGEEIALPPKLSKNLLNFPRYRYPSDLQNSLRIVSELLLVDVLETPEVEKQFYKEAYCEAGALSQHALISKQMLAARYDALFSAKEVAPTVIPALAKSSSPKLSPELAAEALMQRPVVLIGDVGVGKTSFLKHLMYVSAYEEFKGALYLYLDLGSRGALATSLNDFVLSEISRQLYDQYKVDVDESSFVKGVYHKDIAKFDRGLYGPLKTEDRPQYNVRLTEFLVDKTRVRDSHLRESINHIALARKQQVVIVLDNADQREYEIQQQAFIIAQNFAKDWKAAVFIAIWPQTFYQSKQSGALKAYPHRVFTISPPRIDLVVERRLTFALNLAEGRIQAERLKNVGLHLSAIALFLKALLHSLKVNADLVEFLSNITGGNIRAAIDFVTKFIGSANVDAQKIIEIMDRGDTYVVPLHEFWKAAILGDFANFEPASSLATNLFDLSSPNPAEHFLLPLILAYLDHAGPHRSKHGFVSVDAIEAEMQGWGMGVQAVSLSLARANNKKLIETPERITYAEDETGLSDHDERSFRLTTIGAYHLKRWMGEFSYLDAMAFDTPILNDDVRAEIKNLGESFALRDRNLRATTFLQYLTNTWNSLSLQPQYFQWLSIISESKNSFERVSRAILTQASQRSSR